MDIAADRLRSLVDRIERLTEERKALGNDIKDIYAEAKSAGYDVKTLRRLIAIRKIEAAEYEEQEMLLDTYRRALGMLADTPLGVSAVASAAASPAVLKAVRKFRGSIPKGTEVTITSGQTGQSATIIGGRA